MALGLDGILLWMALGFSGLCPGCPWASVAFVLDGLGLEWSALDGIATLSSQTPVPEGICAGFFVTAVWKWFSGFLYCRLLGSSM